MAAVLHWQAAQRSSPNGWIFATGPFAWRTAPWLSPEQRTANRLVSEDDLEQHLKSKPPAAILVGYEPILEVTFVEYAVKHDYDWVELTPESGLWLSPELAYP
jgi:hypothetical protein